MLNLDTHILLYALAGELTARERRLLSGDSWSISAISLWEITKLAQLGRVEIHLEGTVRPATLEELCARVGIDPPPAFHDLATFVESFSCAWAAMITPGDYARLVHEYCEDAARAGVRYAELELTTTGRPYDCLAEAVEAAARQPDIVIRFIAGTVRNLPLELAWTMLDAARGVPEVVGIGLRGPEEGFPPEPFRNLFAEAHR